MRLLTKSLDLRNVSLTSRGMLAAWFILVFSISVTVFLWHHTRIDVMQSARERFDFQVTEAEFAVHQRMLAYKQVLRGGVGLFNSSQMVSREEWRKYVKTLKFDENYPGIQGMGFSRRILSAEKDAHIRQTRSEGFPGYNIWPEGIRTEYTSIIYLEPFDWRNQRAFGYDMFSEPVRREAMERARDTGKAAVSGMVKLVQETDKDVQVGFLMYLPVYRSNAPIDTVEERRAALIGYVYSPFRINDLMHGVLGKKLPQIDLEIFDGNEISEKTLMYDDDLIKLFLEHPLFAKTVSYEIGGHTWTLFFASTLTFESTIDKEKPLIVLTTGTLISLLFFAVALSLATTHGRAVALANDMTEALRKSEEEKLVLQAQMLNAQKLESLGVLAGGIAHDFNNLLTSIMGNTEMALNETPESSPVREYMEKAAEGVKRASELTKQMLAYSGKGRFVIENIDLSNLVESTAELLRISIGKNADITFNLAKNLPQMEADATQIRQVVMNLIINASDAIGENQGIIKVSTGIMECDRAFLNDADIGKELPEGTYVYMEVSDNGCGMDNETKARIFDPFFTTKFTGRGLGLAAVLGIVRGHKGALKVYSKAGEGTTFKVLFPKSDRYIEPKPAEEKKVEGWEGRGTILLVDDEEEVASVTRMMLEGIGFSVLTAKDGLEGVEMFRNHADDIDAVLMDMTMPNMNGEEAFREMKKIRSGVKVILTSGYNEEEISGRFYGAGFAGFLQKPYGFADLSNKVKGIIG